jgi:hypothetical protein
MQTNLGETMDEQTRIQLEAAAFRGLVEHLQRRTDVQNIDLMNLAGFCRNCLSKWYLNAAKEHGVEMDYDEARRIIYGMPFDQWKAKYQKEASADQLQQFEETKPLHAFVSGHHKK